jgi:hypothetical protein
MGPQEQMAMAGSQFHSGINMSPAAAGRAPKQQKAAARRNNQKDLAPKKAFQPYHAIRVPKEADLGGSKQQSPVDEPVTTLMLRNIPNKYTQTVLLQEIDKLGFAGTYDFFYLPMDVHNRSNVGYAFINFIDPSSATLCYSVFSNYKFQRYHSKKICAVSPAHLQGFEKNVKHFQHRAVMNARDNQYRPVVLRSGSSGSQAQGPVTDFSQGQPNADIFQPYYLAENIPETAEPFEESESSFDLPPWPTSLAPFQEERISSEHASRHNFSDQLLEPNLDSSLPSLQAALSDLLRQKNISHLGLAQAGSAEDNYHKMDMPMMVDMLPRENLDLGLAPFPTKQRMGSKDSWHSRSLNSEDPEWVVPQGPGTFQKPPGLDSLPIGRSFEPNDKTPRTNHSLLGGCFGPANGPAWGPAFV